MILALFIILILKWIIAYKYTKFNSGTVTDFIKFGLLVSVPFLGFCVAGSMFLTIIMESKFWKRWENTKL